MNNLNDWFWNKIGNSVKTPHPEKSLGIFRWLYGFYVLLFAAPSYSWISDVPSGFYDPPLISIAWFFDTFPPSFFFDSIDVIVIISIFFVMIGVKARLFTIIFVLVNILGLNFSYSMGKIDHSFLELVLLLCMIIAGWGSYYAILPDKEGKFESPDKALAILAVCISFAMLSAGLPKLVFWIDFDLSTNGFLSWYYGRYLNYDEAFLLLPYIKYLPLWIFELFDYSAIILEISAFIFLLWSRKLWLTWLFIISFFHLANTLTLNIPFLEHVVVYLAFLNLPDKISDHLFNKKKILAIWAATLSLIHLIQRFVYEPASILYISNYQTSIIASVYTGLLLWSVLLLYIFFELKDAYNNDHKKNIPSNPS